MRLTPAVLLRLAPAVFLLAGCASGVQAQSDRICSNRTGEHGGYFYTFWKDGGEACITLGAGGNYATEYDLSGGRNLVTGKGWRIGSPDRVVVYNASAWNAGRNSYLTLYGWSTDPLVEYYVVDSWGSAFKPPGEGAEVLETITSDGGTYEIYRTLRVEKPSIRGTQTFPQFWSVRTERRDQGGDNRITFANHVAAWARNGMNLGAMNYQVMATEGVGSIGSSNITVREE